MLIYGGVGIRLIMHTIFNKVEIVSVLVFELAIIVVTVEVQLLIIVGF